MIRFTLAAGCVLACSSAAPASIFFSFADPQGPLPEITHFEGFEMAGGENADGAISVPTFLPGGLPQFQLLIDGSQEGFGAVQFTSILQMDLSVGQITSDDEGTLQAPVSGSFRFDDANTGETIFFGAFNQGAVFTFGTTGSIVGSSFTIPSSLSITPGPLLQGLLDSVSPGLELEPGFSGSFALTNFTNLITGETVVPSVNPDGFITSFVANAAFSGGTGVVPTPGAALLFGLGGMLVLSRRRR